MISGYGLNKIISENFNLGWYPNFFESMHGWSASDIPTIASFKKFNCDNILCWNKRFKLGLEKAVIKKNFIEIENPFISYRKRKKIKKKKKSNGSLFFLAHSTNETLNNDKLIENIKLIKKLPKKMQPVDICIHWNDFNKKNLKILKKYKINYKCAGPIFSNNFAERFYKILINYNYTLSNSLGSYILLSLDLNIPFSLIGKEPTYTNIKDINITALLKDKHKFRSSHTSIGKHCLKIFKGINLKITKSQRYFFNSEKGKNTISDHQLKKLNFKQMCKVLYSFKGLVYLIKKIIIIKYFYLKRIKDIKKELLYVASN